MGYVANFVEHYSRRLGPGFRPVKSQEAEEADKAMCNEVFRLVFHENGDIDSALSTVVREDILRLKLMPQPKPAKLPAPPPVSKMPKKMLPAAGARWEEVQEWHLLGFPRWEMQ